MSSTTSSCAAMATWTRPRGKPLTRLKDDSAYLTHIWLRIGPSVALL